MARPTSSRYVAQTDYFTGSLYELDFAILLLSYDDFIDGTTSKFIALTDVSHFVSCAISNHVPGDFKCLFIFSLPSTWLLGDKSFLDHGLSPDCLSHRERVIVA